MAGLVMVPVTAGALPSTPTSIQIEQQPGLVGITWAEVGDSSTTYRVRRSTSPIVNATDGTFLGEVGQNTTLNTRATIEGNGTRQVCFYDLEPLPADRGLFVTPTDAAGTYYYAVTSKDASGENTTIIPGVNATTVGVEETPEPPQFVLQAIVTPGNGFVYWIFSLWASNIDTPYYPAMFVQPSTLFSFALLVGIDGGPLEISLHAYGGGYLIGGGEFTGTGIPGRWVYSPDDGGLPIVGSTLWYGLHANYNVNTALPIPTSGICVDYTWRRMIYGLKWVRANFPVASAQTMAISSPEPTLDGISKGPGGGSSMGGYGILMVGIDDNNDGIDDGDSISVRFADVPLANPYGPDEYYVSGFDPGGGHRNFQDRRCGYGELMTTDGIPVRDRMNFAFRAMSQSDSLEQPPIIIYSGRNDVTVGWIGVASLDPWYGAVAALQAQRQQVEFFWGSNDHPGSPAFPNEWNARKWDMTQLKPYNNLHRSYPAFTNNTSDGNRGDGFNPQTADSFGTVNGHVTFDTTIVDIPEQWRIVIRNRDLLYNAGQGNQWKLAPDSLWVDVTPRRLQVFQIVPGISYPYAIRNNTTGVLIDSSFVVGDASGLVTIPAVLVTDQAAKLTIYAAGPTSVGSTSPITMDGLRVSPNPSRDDFRISFRLDEDATIETSVFDLSGRRIRQLSRLQWYRNGSNPDHSFNWDGRDDHGQSVGSGIYFVRMNDNRGRTQMAKLTLIR